jgi:hypothetical protein
MPIPLRPEELLWFNERYASLEIEGDYCVIRIKDRSVYSVEKFKQSLAHMTRAQGNRQMSLAEGWLADEGRRHFPFGVIFDPSSPPTAYDPESPSQPDRFNLFRGFPVDPIEGDVAPFLDFTLNTICNGDKNLFEYVMAWLANIIQDPTKKPGTALVLRGDQGIGKGFFASCLGEVLGHHYQEVNDPVSLVGRFNHHLRDKLLIYADEGSFSGRKATDKLKNMITSEQVLIEQKFRTPYNVDNFMRIIISGNHEWLIIASHDERRYCILDVSPRHQGDWSYWDKMFAWRDNGGAAALLHHLREYEIKINLREIPKTRALWEHKLQSLDDFWNWYLDCLFSGDLGTGKNWEGWHPSDALLGSFLDHCGKVYDRSSATQFGTLLKKRVPRVSKSRAALGGRQTYGYRLPPLHECRRAFEGRFGEELDWPEVAPNLTVVDGQNAP